MMPQRVLNLSLSVILIAASSYPVIRPATAEYDTSWFGFGKPYQVGARCIGALLLYPQIENIHGELEELENVIASDPWLDIDTVQDHDRSGFVKPTSRAWMLNLVLGYVYNVGKRTTKEDQVFLPPPDKIKSICDQLIRDHLR